uniref:Uncharacterized protein n=1 Tax=Arundo donax TaxID=35708 RepID=A0A0A8ZE14_ARUDO
MSSFTASSTSLNGHGASSINIFKLLMFNISTLFFLKDVEHFKLLFFFIRDVEHFNFVSPDWMRDVTR